MTIKHAFHTPVLDDSDPNKVQPRHWNAVHVVEILTSDPVAPAIGDLWFLGTGTTPTRTVELKFCDTDGAIVSLFTVVR